MMQRFISIVLLGWVATAGAATNLVVNGSFDSTNSPFEAWKTVYDLPGESWYFGNHSHIKAKDVVEGRKHVASMWGNYELLQVPGQGVKIDSRPIPVKNVPGCQFRLSCYARSTGPFCRILIEGYKWRPGIKPHDDPPLHELRPCYKFSQVYFGGQEAGTMAQPTKSWQRGETVFPNAALTKSDTSKENLNLIRFLVVHIIAIGGSEGELFVDDVRLEQLKGEVYKPVYPKAVSRASGGQPLEPEPEAKPATKVEIGKPIEEDVPALPAADAAGMIE